MNSARPNIVFFTWHDAGDWFGCYGYDTVRTPNVDRLAAEGARFRNFFSTCAICSPSRASIMTGRHIQNHGVVTLTNSPFAPRIHPQVPHLAATLKKRGYHTTLIGVQHECAHEHVDGIMQVDEKIASDPWSHGGLLAHHVREWIHGQRHAEKPFYAQIGTYDAHLGRFFQNRPADRDEPYPPVQDTSRGLYLPPYLTGSEADRACVSTLQGQLHRGDTVMGAVLDGLDEAGLSENTLVIMQVDHGVGLDRAKATCHEAGTRVASIMRWPGSIAAGLEVEALASHVDVLPTLGELLGVALAPTADGISLAGHLRGEPSPASHDAVFSQMVEAARSIRTTRHRLIRNFTCPTHGLDQKGDCARNHVGFDSVPAAADLEYPMLELYDLENDPHELVNLAGKPAWKETEMRLDADLWEFLLEHDDFVLHRPMRTDWDAKVRLDLESHCRRTGRRLSPAVGPLGNPIDRASSVGRLL